MPTNSKHPETVVLRTPRLPQRSGDHGCGGADLPDHQFPVQQHPARPEPVRAG